MRPAPVVPRAHQLSEPDRHDRRRKQVPMPDTYELFIDGAWTPAENAETIDILSPSTGDVVGRVADATARDAVAAVEAASAAMPAWAAMAPRERAEILRACFEAMTANREEIAHLISSENGKSLADSRGEVDYAAEFFRWYAEEAVRVIGQVSVAPSGSNRILVQHQPIGVSVLITPWNFPAAMATRKIAPALAAGCSVVLKPATQTPLTAFYLADCLRRAGVPDGVVNVITTSRTSEVVGAMLDDDRVRKLSFTGSTEVGRLLLRQAADNVLKCSMELGGNAPVIVLHDADVNEAVDGVMVAKFRNGGQACTAANRIFVHESVMAEFAERLTERITALRVGAGTDPDTDIGPLVDEASVQKVSRLIDDAVAHGARVVVGGAALDRPGHFFAPTIVTDVPLRADIVAEEIFGPVAVLIPFSDDGEVIDAANDTEYGLSAYLFTGDLKRGLALSERLEFGMVGLNRGLVSDPAAPFGGVKHSGLGREGAHVGLLEFTETKYIATSW